MLNSNIELLTQIADSSHIGILVVDKKRNNLFVNNRLCEMFNYDKDTLLSTNAEIFHINNQNFKEFAELAFNAVLKGKPLSIDYQFKKSDGALFWAHITGDPIKSQNKVLWTLVDITSRIESEKKEKELKERLELALLGNNDGIWDLNLKDNTTYYSPRWKEMLGYKDNELENKLSVWENLVNPDDIEKVWDEIYAHINHKSEYYEGIHRLKHKNGSWVWILSRAKAIFDEDGNALRMIGTHTDITEEKELQLKYSKQAQIIQQTDESILSIDLYGKIVTWNEGAKKLYGYDFSEVIGKKVSILQAKEDFCIIEKVKDELFKNEKYTSDIVHMKKNKELIDVSLSLSLLKNQEGSVTNIVCYTKDISQRKKAEKALMEQHKYYQSIIDGVDDPIMVIKDDYSIELMNSTLKESINPKNVKDINNPKCYEVSHGRSTPCEGDEHPCPLREVLNTNKHTTVIHTHKNSKEENRFVELSASPIFDSLNNCVGIIESSRDITSHLEVQNKLLEQKDILNFQATHDALTGLPNRFYFQNNLENLIKKSNRHKQIFAILFIDLDHFKEINDSLGHLVGDEILKSVSNSLRKIIREEDTLARLGGDEFTVLLENLTSPQDASMIANKILNILSKEIIINENILYVSSSIGISVYPSDGKSAENLLKYADSAMYKAKSEGRNNYQYYNSVLTENACERVFMESSLRSALKNKEFIVYFQPQVDGITDKIIGMEALVRWEHPTLGILFPDNFIPLAEATGLILEIDNFVMKSAMKQFTTWYEKGFNPGKLSMNLSVKQLGRSDFISTFLALISETKCKSKWITLEITESHIIKDPDKANEILNELSNLGVELAIDDFGTGYSSLAYLKKLPINKLKIDKTFISDLPNDEDDSSIVKSVIVLAKSLNLKIIAEGVELKSQKDFIIENGCNEIQGFFYFKPMLPKDIENLL